MSLPCVVPERYYTPTTIKTLFALSGNRCAFPGCDEQLTSPSWAKVKGEIAHIRGLRHGAERHECNFAGVNDFENLLVLCPNHHEEIDGLEPGRWTKEELLRIKAGSEQRAAPSGKWTSEAALDALVRVMTERVRVEAEADRARLDPPRLEMIVRGGAIVVANLGPRAAFQWTIDPRNDGQSADRGASFEEMQSWEHNEDAPIAGGAERRVGKVTDEGLLRANPEVVILRWNDSSGETFSNLCTISV